MTKLSLIALLSVATALPAAAQRYNGQVSFTPAQVKAAADSVRLNLGVVLDGVRLGSRTLVTLTPRLVSQDGTQTYTFSPVSFGGRNRDIMWKRHNFPGTPRPVVLRSGEQRTLPLTLTAPNVAWVKKARLVVDEQVQGCAGCEEGAMRYNLLDRLVKEEYRPQFTTAYVMPTPEPVKMRSDRFVARFNFKVNRYELLPNLGNNRVEFARVDSVAQVILRNSDVQVKNVTIDGYASPEGTDAGNLKLSQNRAQAFVDYLRRTYGLSTRIFAVRGHGSDWAGLRQRVEQDPQVPNLSGVLEVLNQDGNNEARKAALRKLDGGAPYAYLLDTHYPPLRRTEYQFTYAVRAFNLQEAIERIHTNPALLSLNEMYLVAESFPAGSVERRNALETAQRLFPNAPESRFNTLANRLVSAQTEADEAFLRGYADGAEKWNNLGVYYGLKKDYARAKECFQRAGQLPAAVKNLAELAKVDAE